MKKKCLFLEAILLWRNPKTTGLTKQQSELLALNHYKFSRKALRVKNESRYLIISNDPGVSHTFSRHF